MDVPWRAILLIAILCLASAGVWRRLWDRRRTLLTFARIRPPMPMISRWAVGLTVLWLLNRLALEVDAWFRSAPEIPFAPEPILESLKLTCVLQAGMLGVYWMVAAAGMPGQAAALGVTSIQLSKQCRNALVVITAAWLPVFATLLATYPLRSAERQHAVLRMLQEYPSLEAYFWAILSAVLMAPLIEELLFRVILQSWLTTHLGRRAGWLIASFLFASVHGFPDSIALLPLALILGAAWHLTRRYWTIVTAHALFNAVMLVLDALLPEG